MGGAISLMEQQLSEQAYPPVPPSSAAGGLVWQIVGLTDPNSVVFDVLHDLAVWELPVMRSSADAPDVSGQRGHASSLIGFYGSSGRDHHE